MHIQRDIRVKRRNLCFAFLRRWRSREQNGHWRTVNKLADVLTNTNIQNESKRKDGKCIFKKRQPSSSTLPVTTQRCRNPHPLTRLRFPFEWCALSLPMIPRYFPSCLATTGWKPLLGFVKFSCRNPASKLLRYFRIDMKTYRRPPVLLDIFVRILLCWWVIYLACYSF